MKKSRLLIATLVIILGSSFSAQAQCNSVNTHPDFCTDTNNEINTSPITIERSVLPGDVYYVQSSAQGHPWGQNTNPVAMDAVFGAGNWTQEFFESASPATLFSDDTSLIYIDGSDDNTPALNTFVTANGAAMETWVNNGGLLFFNAASQGPDVPVFDDIQLIYDLTSNVVSTNANHPAFIGPLTTLTSFSGNSYAHNLVEGSGLTTILVEDGDNTDVILAEGVFGDGYLLVGGMTTNNYHNPVTEATNFRTNLLHMMANAPDITTCQADETVAVTEGETYTLPDYVASGDVVADNATSIVQNPPAGTEIDSDAGTQEISFTAINNSIIEDFCSFMLTIDEILGTNDAQVNTFSMYPNPARSSFNVEGNFTIESVAIYNLLGQKVIEVASNQVEVSNIKAGMYLVTVTDANGNQASKRLIKK